MGLCAVGLAVLAMGSGCATGGGDAVHKQLAELDAQVTKLRAESAILADRLEMLSRKKGDGPGAPASAEPRPSPSPVSSDRPELEVVTLAPEPEPAAPAQAKSPKTQGGKAAPPENPVLRNSPTGRVEMRENGKTVVYDGAKVPAKGGK
jgi:hypothetical protein